MTRADSFKCMDCGNEWYWTEEDYAENERLRRGGVLVSATGILTTRGSYSIADAVTNHHLITKGMQMQEQVVDFSRCPNPRCRSRRIVKTGSHEIGGAPGATQGVKKPLTAALLGIFLGGFGAHKFYLGYNKEGAIMLAVWLVGLIAMAIPSIIMSIIGLIEGIIYLTKDTYAFQATYIQGHKGWF